MKIGGKKVVFKEVEFIIRGNGRDPRKQILFGQIEGYSYGHIETQESCIVILD